MSNLLLLLLQVHVKLTGSSRVLINTDNLPGVNAKALQLSKREERDRCSHPDTNDHATMCSCHNVLISMMPYALDVCHDFSKDGLCYMLRFSFVAYYAPIYAQKDLCTHAAAMSGSKWHEPGWNHSCILIQNL